MKHNLILIAAASAALILPSLAQDADPFAGGGGSAGGGDATDDPFAKGASRRVLKNKTQPDPGDADLSVRYEAFSLDLATAAALMRAEPSDAKLYETLVGMLKTEKAKQESLMIVRTRSGQRAKTESISEYIYPTEWDPAEIPNSIGVKIDPPLGPNGKPTTGNPNVEALDEAQTLDELPDFVTPATPTAFETRNVGTTFEVDVVRNGNGMIELNISPEHVTLVGNSDWGQGVSKVPMPEFECQRITTAALLAPGVPRLLGTISRTPNSKVGAPAVPKIWFAFATASPVK